MSAPRASIRPASLRGLDALRVEALALPMAERPGAPQGVAGRVDWRLRGRLSRLLVAGRFRPLPGEALLTSAGDGLSVERVFLLGVGIGEVGRTGAVSVLVEAGVRSVALAPLDAEDPVEEALVWLRALGGRAGAFDELVLLDPDGRLDSSRARVARQAASAGLALEDPPR